MDVLKSLLSWKQVAATVAAYLASLAFYRLFLHPLARFPGSKLAAASRWFEGYYDVVLDGQYTFKIAEMHRQYGTEPRLLPHMKFHV
jgi:hypothetical protein